MSAVLKQGPDALAALMAYVAQVRDQQLARIGEAAARECQALLGAARARARDQIRQALREVRADADAQIAVARAGMQARLRRRRQALTLAALADVQRRVREAVLARWHEPAAQRRWLAMALAEAARALPAGPWILEHPAGMAAVGPVELPGQATLEARAEPALAAGVRIRCGDATLDATLDGLLRAPERLAAQWLGELERRRAAGTREAA